jgi:hypothetical protein
VPDNAKVNKFINQNELNEELKSITQDTRALQIIYHWDNIEHVWL